jgi:Zn-dependent peptidase ImmA (M78 family)
MLIELIQAEMPDSIGGFAVQQQDRYKVVVNKNRAREEQLESIFHEIGHIWRGDFTRKKLGSIEEHNRDDLQEVARNISGNKVSDIRSGLAGSNANNETF